MRKITPMNIFAKLMIASVFCSSTAKLYEVHASEVAKYTNRQNGTLGTIRTSALYYVGDVLANGWVFHEQPVDGYYYLFYKDGVRLTGMGTDADGEHLFIDGVLAQGIQSYNGIELFYENGNPVTGFRNGKYYVSGYIANGWMFHKEPIDGKYYLFYKDGVRLTGAGIDAKGEEHYYVNGLLADGINNIIGVDLLYENGDPVTGFRNGKYYVSGYIANGWVFHKEPIDGKYYLFYKDGVRLTGKGIDAKNEEHYYVNGVLAEGNITFDGVTRLYKNGDPVSTIDSGKYYVNGVLAEGIQNITGVNLFYEKGEPVTGFRNGKYYVSGYIANGWMFHKEPIDGKYYLFYKDGVRLTGKGIDAKNEEHYYVNGVLAEGVQNITGVELLYEKGDLATGFRNGKYYIGGYIANGWVFHKEPIDGKYYLFYKDGVRLTGKGIDAKGEEHYYLNGVLAEGIQNITGVDLLYEKGDPVTGFRNGKYYVSGYIANGWMFHKDPIDGKYYLFYKDGVRLTGKGIDAKNEEHYYYNGVLAQGYNTFDGITRFYKDGDPVGEATDKYYVDGHIANGWMYHKEPIDGYHYLFYKDGVRLTGKGIDAKNEEHYYVNGILAEGIQNITGVDLLYEKGDPVTGYRNGKYYVSGYIANGWVFHKEPINSNYYLFYKDGVLLTGKGIDAKNEEHYFVDGLLAEGLHIQDGEQIYYKSGDRFTGPVGNKYYVNGQEANGWMFHQQPIDGHYYYFYRDGVRLTGMGIDAKNEQHYYVNGLLAQGIYEYDGAKHLFVNGDLVNGWYFHQQPVDGKYYLFYENGERLTGIGKDANGEHLFINGLLAQGYNYYAGQYQYYKDGNVVDVQNEKYYINGVLANGWMFHQQPIDGKYYLFYKDGLRLTGIGTDANGDHLFINGILAQGMQNYEDKYRLYEDGNLVTGFRNGKYYVSGYIANGWVRHTEPIDGTYYLFYKDGVRLTGKGIDANGDERLYLNGILAQGLQTYAGEQRIYKDGEYANGWVNGIYALNGYYANGWVTMDNGEEEYFEYGKSASPKTLRENYTNEEFIQVMAYYIRKYSAQYGIKVNSGILAQAILESNWGRSTLSAKYHNYFGLKAGPYWTGRSVNMATQEEYVPGTYTNIRDNFRAFNSLEEGVRGYFEFTKFPNYAKIKTATTPEEYLTYIKQAGYATSSTYVQNTMRVVQTYNLTKYD